MNVSRLEALADAIAFYHRSFDPDSKAYKLRNPGLLKAVSLKYPRDEEGYRVFSSVLDGYQALLFDLKLKCSGKSKVKVTTLADLLIAGYGEVTGSVPYITKFIRKALKTEDLLLSQSLSYFLED